MRLPAVPLLLCCLACALPSSGTATQLPHQHDGGDARILHFHYRENEVYQIDLNFRFITQVQFAKGETIRALQIGDSVSFQVTPLKRGDIFTVKPLIEDARTNLNIITNKRTYTFYLRALPNEEYEARDGTNFRISFEYPADAKRRASFVALTSGTRATGHKWNTAYQLSGRADFAPLEVYDDGVNTWIRYDKAARRPAVFRTDDKGRESLVNHTAHPNHVVQLHGLSDFWSLRIGDELVCIRRTPGR